MVGCRPLSQDEIYKIYNNINNLRDKTLFLFSLYTGFRINETLSAKIGDVLNSQGEIVDRITIKRSNMKGKIQSRTVFIHPNLRTHLKAFIAMQTKNPSDYLFKSKKGSNQPLKRIQAWKVFKDAVKKAGLEGKIGLHSTRKTFADQMYNAFGKDLLKTSKALGHKNIGSTISYLSFRTEEIDDAISNLDFVPKLNNDQK